MAEHFELIVRGGTLVTGSGRRRADVALRGGRVAAVAEAGQLPGPAEAELDATGCFVLPGLIDAHVHFREPGLEHKEDWLTGSRAAVMGGITTVLEMPNTIPPTATAEAARAKRRLATAKSYCNFGLFGLLGADNSDELPALARSGLVVGLKVFLGPTTGDLAAPSDQLLIRGLRVAREAGLRVCFHAEDRRLLEQAEERLRRARRSSDPLAHLASRPPEAELAAIDHAGRLLAEARASGHILHLSSADGLVALERWRRRGLDLTAEVTPHHCLFSAADHERLGALLKCNPPVRERRHAEALRAAIADGRIQLIASDHAPHAPSEKAVGQGRSAAAGIGGVETTLRLFLTHGVNAGLLPLERLVQLLAENPAKVWGLWPRKGSLELGADGDLTIVDLQQRGVIRTADLHGKHALTPFDGWPTLGAPVATVVRGRVVMQGGRLLGEPGWGQAVESPPRVA